jgi:hypothetical protein
MGEADRFFGIGKARAFSEMRREMLFSVASSSLGKEGD